MAPSASEKASLNSAARLEWTRCLSIISSAQSFSICHITFFICHRREVAIPPTANGKCNMTNGKRNLPLFISQRFNRRKLRRAARRVNAGDEADGRGDREADEGHERARACGQRRDPGDQARDEHPGGRPHNSAEQTERY